MIALENTLISEDLLEKQFVCDLSKCKGACCVEGDSGAPLELDEPIILEEIAESVKPFLPEEGVKALERNGAFELDEYEGKFKTTLREDGACSFVTFDEKGVAMCGIEQAWQKGAVSFRKPISCHLYPVRIKKLPDYDALNYEVWDICDPACKMGASLQVPIYRFVKDALIRKYGQEYYDMLDAYASQEESSEDLES